MLTISLWLRITQDKETTWDLEGEKRRVACKVELKIPRAF